MIDYTKTIALIEKSERIAILFPEDASFDCRASAEVLSRFLEQMGKYVGYVTTPPSSHTFSVDVPLRARSPLPKEFIISLRTEDAPVSQLRYEKNDSHIDVVFSPKTIALSEQSVSFREGKTHCDLIITLGIDTLEQHIPSFMEPELLSETPIINIDISKKNKEFGEINIVAPEKTSLAEAVYDCIAALEEKPLDKESATLLLAAILSETDDLHAPNINADTLLTASECMRLDADIALAKQWMTHPQSLAMTQLCARATVRSKLDTSRGIVWSFITAEDFEKTGRSASDIPHILPTLAQTLPLHRMGALLWQNQQDNAVYAALFGQDRTALETIQSQEGGEFQSPHLVLHRTFPSFVTAEEYLRSLLEEIL